jgi:hypothetical protein
MMMRRKPANERYAAAAKRVHAQIARYLECGEYRRVQELSKLLQELMRKACDHSSQ